MKPPFIIAFTLFFMYFAGLCHANCQAVLWERQPEWLPSELKEELRYWADQFVLQGSHPIKKLQSAGETAITSQPLRVTRKALMEADKAVILAMMYVLTHRTIYLDAAEAILVKWALVNQPTGNPIDETKLAGMIWAYDLIACHLSFSNQALITQWLREIYKKKIKWPFKKVTSTNNHRIHQLKLIWMLEAVLHQPHSQTLLDIKYYAQKNINPQTGKSLDYIQRDALYYQNYVLQPWIEIELMSHCCTPTVEKAFTFLKNKILMHQTGDEFLNSSAAIDRLREQGGFVYAKKGGNFELEKAAPTIIAYYTFNSQTPNQLLWEITTQAKASPWLTFLKIRRILWLRHPHE